MDFRWQHRSQKQPPAIIGTQIQARPLESDISGCHCGLSWQQWSFRSVWPLDTACRHQHGSGMQHRSQTSAWPSVVTLSIDVNVDSSWLGPWAWSSVATKTRGQHHHGFRCSLHYSYCYSYHHISISICLPSARTTPSFYLSHLSIRCSFIIVVAAVCAVKVALPGVLKNFLKYFSYSWELHAFIQWNIHLHFAPPTLPMPHNMFTSQHCIFFLLEPTKLVLPKDAWNPGAIHWHVRNLPVVIP